MKKILEKEKLSEPFRREMMEEMVETFGHNEYCGDEEFSLAEKLCYTDEDRLAFANLLKENDTEHARIASILKSVGTEEQYVSYLEEAQHRPQNAIELYHRALSQDDRDKALSYLWNCLSASPYSKEVLNVLLDAAESGSIPEGCTVIERILPILDDRVRPYHLEACNRMYQYLLKNQITDLRFRLILETYRATGSNAVDDWFQICISDLPTDIYRKNADWILEHLKRCSPQTYYCYRH